MIQKHNRDTSFSIYISVLAVVDTMTLLIGRRKFHAHYGRRFSDTLNILPEHQSLLTSATISKDCDRSFIMDLESEFTDFSEIADVPSECQTEILLISFKHLGLFSRSKPNLGKTIVVKLISQLTRLKKFLIIIFRFYIIY